MNKTPLTISLTLACLVIAGGGLYFYSLGRGNPDVVSSHSEPGSAVSRVNSSVNQTVPPVQRAVKKAALSSAAPDEGFSAEEQRKNLENLVEQKYSILFSMLKLSAQTQQALHTQLILREQLMSSPFYDASSNEAEVAANLNKREQEVAEIDQAIETLLSEADVKKYHLLKDSTYEQAQMAGFYELANAETSIQPELKNKLLLAKLELKQSTRLLLASDEDNIKHAALDTKNYLIEKMHQAMVHEKESYLSSVKSLLSEEQFDVLKDYEQQLFVERWQDISAGLRSE